MLALYRIVEPASGSVVIDGVDVGQIGLQDLRSRLNMPEAFSWAGVDVYLNGHDHIMELSNRDEVKKSNCNYRLILK